MGRSVREGSRTTVNEGEERKEMETRDIDSKFITLRILYDIITFSWDARAVWYHQLHSNSGASVYYMYMETS